MQTKSVQYYLAKNVQKDLTVTATNGYLVRSVVDTSFRSQGKDIIASDLEGIELWISVKEDSE